MEAESNVNQISNIDLAEEVTEETPQPVQNHTPEIDEERRKEMMEEITKVSNTCGVQRHACCLLVFNE